MWTEIFARFGFLSFVVCLAWVLVRVGNWIAELNECTRNSKDLAKRLCRAERGIIRLDVLRAEDNNRVEKRERKK